ncbi:MobA/MobL family protein [Luteibacter sp. PPL201]|uniref:MobA/MobL family protein n=1 Tax=Luteibacter sahnii TaxID=3021977 RepID=A0ABT6B938_9GAMM
MPEHARPHLHTHHRSSNHSAVAGAAYRLGLKLFDEHAGKWHDYSKRAGNAVVHAQTVAPPGAPAWLSDSVQLWNAVEKQELRTNSQLARDYRIPIPFGVEEKGAVAMSVAMARYIVSRFNVPVSIGVHRDNSVDLDGNAKPADKVGFHAHLYFPTRRLEREGSGEGATWRLGAKLSELANKSTSGHLVDAMNDKWAVLANRYAEWAGVPAIYASKSYARLGLDKTPRPERARRFGKANNWQRKQGGTPGNPHRPARAASGPLHLLQGMQGKANAGAAHRAAGTGRPAASSPGSIAIDFNPDALASRLAKRRSQEGANAERAARRARERAGKGIEGRAPLLSRVAFVAGRTVRIDHHLRLSEAMRRAGGSPKTDAEHAALERAMLLADILDAMLFYMERARQTDADFRMRLMRERMKFEDAMDKQRMLDGEARKANARLDQWLRASALRAQFRSMSSGHGTLASRQMQAAGSARRAHEAVNRHRTVLTGLERKLDADAQKTARRIDQLIDAMLPYRLDFPRVLRVIGPELSDAQRLEVEAAAEKLGVVLDNRVPLARAEAPFRTTAKRL